MMSPLLFGWYSFEWLLRIVALFVVPRNRKPASGAVWLMIIFLVPAIGWLIFLVLGNFKLPKSRRKAQQTLDHYLVAQLDQFKRTNAHSRPIVDAMPPQKYIGVAQLSRALTHLPVFSQNNLQALTAYETTITRIIADIKRAHYFVYVEYYIIVLDRTTEPFIQALEQAQARGVVVRLLYDAYGSVKSAGFRAMKHRLQLAGVHVQASLPLSLVRGYVRPDLRNHRKLVVIDGKVGYTGSQNMIQRNYHRRDGIVYDELVVRLEGPAVLQLEAVFETDWFSETGTLLLDVRPPEEQVSLQKRGGKLVQLVPSGPGYEDENNLKVFTSVFYAAKKYITIVNPYFVPDESLITALVSAARRGVKVKLLNSAAVDQWMVAHAQRSYYEQMLRAGVQVYLYRAPTLLHSKYIVVDDDIVLVGSSNMDIRSFELNHELMLTVYNASFARQLNRIAYMYQARSRRLDTKAWLARRRYKQLFDNLARLTSSVQ